ncbi:hypothetical protein [Persicobacter psychrovividus]|uniref:Uncharacterized protein n=1 Tax=Persicobacter psychrovividus TaxID=387638 RepID=A0ABM7VMW8_9BACT|nr:hypothetical protein PEPS_46460 [Persicobacter psychrovividus]
MIKRHYIFAFLCLFSLLTACSDDPIETVGEDFGKQIRTLYENNDVHFVTVKSPELYTNINVYEGQKFAIIGQTMQLENDYFNLNQVQNFSVNKNKKELYIYMN